MKQIMMNSIFRMLTLIAKPFYLQPIKKIVVFESQLDFSDNAKYLFEVMIGKNINEDYKIYWLVQDAIKFKNINIKNVKFINNKRTTIMQRISSEIKTNFLLGRCKFYFYTHGSLARVSPKKQQVYFHLTHGVSLKNLTGQYDASIKDTYVLATSDFTSEIRAVDYNVEKERIKILGFPRNDLLLNTKNKNLQLAINSEQYKKTIVWMPTFRRQKNQDRNDSGTIEHTDLPILKTEKDILTLNDYLAKKNILLIIKPHPVQDMNFFKTLSTKNIKILTNKDLDKYEVDLYELLGQSDALISDYSSVYIDYLLINKPIGFTIDDLDGYSKNLGFHVDNPLNYMPGDKITNIEAMKKFISAVIQDDDQYAEDRKKMAELFHKYNDNQSSQRILTYLELL